MAMLRGLSLLVPALMPSWRFFDVITAAPRIEVSHLATPDATPIWAPFRPKPQRSGVAASIGRLLWNPDGNATLYLNACVERVAEGCEGPYLDHISAAVRSEMGGSGGWVCFRLCLRYRDGSEIVEDVIHQSPALPLS